MAFLNPEDPENGWSAFDYARAILAELGHIHEKVGDDGLPESLTRFQTRQADPWDGAATERLVRFTVPPGVTWKLLGFTVYSGNDAQELTRVPVYRGDVGPSTLLDQAPASLGGAVSRAAPYPVTLGENTVLVFRVISAAAIPATNVATVNLIVEQTPLGPPPRDTDGGGEF